MATTRINEKYIYGSLVKYLDDNISGVLFYSTEEEPDISGSGLWCIVDLDHYEESPSAKEDWLSRGRLTLHIISKSGKWGDTYSSRDIADQASELLVKGAVTISVGGNEKGKITFGNPVSHSLGQLDGALMHWWSIEFFVFSTS